MNRFQSQVQRFHREIIDQPTSPAEPTLRHPPLRAALILEEALETVVALLGTSRAIQLVDRLRAKLQYVPAGHPEKEPDIVKVIDGLCDLVYVALGTAEDIGVDLEPFFDEVHRSNMAKRDPERSQKSSAVPVGKAIKPPGWTPPDIAGLLDRVRAGH